ncbi:MAG: recombination protein RecR [Flavobacteriales bacterium]|nr:MAG: recombination protein RecR [Flavobacteriales bacterium]
MNSQISSLSFNNAVEKLASLPGIGNKTALRLILQLLNRDSQEIEAFGNAFIQLSNQIQYCNSCHNISDTITCSLCLNPSRSNNIICVVENILDVIAIERTNQFQGKFHVLGGIISPMDGIGPNDIKIPELIERINIIKPTEIIMALSTTMEGDATNFYIYKKLAHLDINVTTIARGVGIGDEIEYTDELTLGRSLLNRIPFKSTLVLK